jgi:cell division protein FtsZ
MDAYSQNAVIKVIGVGGGGGNAVAHMVTSGIEGVEFMCINTDAQALKHSKVKTSLQIGCNITKGLGAGADPEVGRQAAMEDRDRIIEMIEGCDMLFITAGMGGGTGTGAGAGGGAGGEGARHPHGGRGHAPFEMEGGKRTLVANHGLAELGKYVDSLITIPNQKLLTVLGAKTTLLRRLQERQPRAARRGARHRRADHASGPHQRRLRRRAHGDERDRDGDDGFGRSRGENRAKEAAEMAVSSPLLEDINLSGAHGILVNVTAGMDLSIGEFQEVGNIIKQFASDDATGGRGNRHRSGAV